MNEHITDVLAKIVGWAVAMVMLGFVANICWILIYAGWSIVDYVSK